MIQIVAAICMFEFGMVLSSVGAMKLSLAKSLGIDNVRVAGLISALMLTNAVSVLAVGPMVDFLGHRPIAVFGLSLGAAGFAMLAVVRSYDGATAACVALGIGGTCTCTVSSTLFPLVFFRGANTAAAANLGNVFFGLGAATTAAVTSFSSGKGTDHRSGGIVLALLIAAAIAPALFAEYPTVRTEFHFSAAVALLARPAILVATLVYALNTGVVNSMGLWLSSHSAALGFPPRSANLMLALFWGAITFARLVTSFVVTSENGAIAIALLAIATGVLLGSMILVRNKVRTAVLMLLTGCALGPITPTVTGVIFARTDPALYGSVFAVLSAIGFIGASVIPASVGLYARRRSVQEALIIPMSASVVIVLLSLLFSRI